MAMAMTSDPWLSIVQVIMSVPSLIAALFEIPFLVWIITIMITLYFIGHEDKA